MPPRNQWVWTSRLSKKLGAVRQALTVTQDVVFFMRDIERSTQSKYFVFCTGCTEGRKEDISQGRKNRTGWGHCRIRIIYPCVSLWQAYLCVYFSHFLFKSAPFVIVKIRPSVIGAMAAQVWAMWLIALAGFLSCHTVACLQKGKVSRFLWMQSMCVLRTHFINELNES